VKNLFAAFVVALLMLLLAPPATAQRLRDGMELNRYSGNALTVWVSYNIPGVAQTFETSASSDGSTKVDIPADASNIQIVALADGRAGKNAGFQDKKRIQILLGSLVSQGASGLGRMRIVAEQSNDTQKGLKDHEKWPGLLVYNASPADFSINLITVVRVNHPYNATVPTLLVKRLPLTYRQIVEIQIGAINGTRPGVVDHGNGGNGSHHEAQPNRPAGPQGLVDDEEDDFDPRSHQNDKARPRSNGHERRHNDDDEDYDPRGNGNGREHDRDRDFERGNDRKRPGGSESPERIMPASGRLTIKMVDREGEPAVMRRALELDITINGQFVRTILITGEEWSGLIPAGEIDIHMYRRDASNWVIGRYSVVKVKAGYSGTLTLKEVAR